MRGAGVGALLDLVNRRLRSFLSLSPQDLLD